MPTPKDELIKNVLQNIKEFEDSTGAEVFKIEISRVNERFKCYLAILVYQVYILCLSNATNCVYNVIYEDI